MFLPPVNTLLDRVWGAANCRVLTTHIWTTLFWNAVPATRSNIWVPIQRRSKEAAEPNANDESNVAALGAATDANHPSSDTRSVPSAELVASLQAEVESLRELRREALLQAHGPNHSNGTHRRSQELEALESQVRAEREKADTAKSRLAATMAAKLAAEVEVDDLQAQLKAEREELSCAQAALAAAVSESSKRASQEQAAVRRMEADLIAERSRGEEARSRLQEALLTAANLTGQLERECQRVAHHETENARLLAALSGSAEPSISTPRIRALATPGLLSPDGPCVQFGSDFCASPQPTRESARIGEASATRAIHTADELITRNRQLEEELCVEAEAAEAAEAALHHLRRSSLVESEELERLRTRLQTAAPAAERLASHGMASQGLQTESCLLLCPRCAAALSPGEIHKVPPLGLARVLGTPTDAKSSPKPPRPPGSGSGGNGSGGDRPKVSRPSPARMSPGKLVSSLAANSTIRRAAPPRATCNLRCG